MAVRSTRDLEARGNQTKQFLTTVYGEEDVPASRRPRARDMFPKPRPAAACEWLPDQSPWEDRTRAIPPDSPAKRRSVSASTSVQCGPTKSKYLLSSGVFHHGPKARQDWPESFCPTYRLGTSPPGRDRQRAMSQVWGVRLLQAWDTIYKHRREEGLATGRTLLRNLHLWIGGASVQRQRGLGKRIMTGTK